jgi:hypothetical protein
MRLWPLLLLPGLPATASATCDPDWQPYAWSAAGEEHDLLGEALVMIDLDADGYADLLAAGANGIGVVRLWRGGPAGLEEAPTTAWYGAAPADLFGARVTPAGDVDADGFPDVLISAPGAEDGEADEGLVWLMYGGPTLPSPRSQLLQVDQAGASFGLGAAGVGDVDGDGYDDVALGAPDYDEATVDDGKVWLLRGGPDGLRPGWAWSAPQPGGRFGAAVAAPGDFDGDGVPDLAVGAPLAEDGEFREGLIYLLPLTGGAAPTLTLQADQRESDLGASLRAGPDIDGDGLGDVVAAMPAWRDRGEPVGAALLFSWSAGSTGRPRHRWVSTQPGSALGRGLALGDLDGDGAADVIAGAEGYTSGAPGAGGVLLLRGGAGLSDLPHRVWEPLQSGNPLAPTTGWGRGVAVGDIDGDGPLELAIGAPSWTEQGAGGRVVVAQGQPGGPPAPTTGGALALPSPRAQWAWGFAVAGAGDVDGDGYGDLLVGAPGYDGGAPGQGAAFLFRGSPFGPEPTPAWVYEGEGAGASAGQALAGAGDVNGDGYADVVIGAPFEGAGQPGAARVFLGGPAGLSTQADMVWTGEQARSLFGQAVDGAGDLDGDGRDEVVVGALHGEGELRDEGAAWLYHRDAAGAWSARRLVGGERHAQLGNAVAGGGDVDGDGLDDALIGAWAAAGEAGAVWLVPGDPAVEPQRWLGDPAARLGTSVDGAGDVNGDGYADVVAGAAWADERRGQVNLYLGGEGGPSPLPDQRLTSDHPGGAFGWSAVGTGDLDADGYDDVLILSPGGWGRAGAVGRRALWHRGGPSGLTATPDWCSPWGVLPHQSWSIAGVGDLNGDGHPDLAVGVPALPQQVAQEGVLVWFGTTGGPRPPPTLAGLAPIEADEGAPVTLVVTASAATTWTLGDGATAAGTTVDHAWADDGTYAVSVEAVDPDGLRARLTTTAVVHNVAPVFESAPPDAAAALDYTPVVFDPGDDALTFSLAGPEGATLDPASGRVTWAPPEEMEATFMLTVEDGDGGVATQRWVTRVRGVVVVEEVPADPEGCGCSTGGEHGVWVLWVGVLGRRRTPRSRRARWHGQRQLFLHPSDNYSCVRGWVYGTGAAPR